MSDIAIEATPATSASLWRRGRRFTYELLHTPEIETRTEHYVRVFIAVLIGLSMVAVVLESIKE